MKLQLPNPILYLITPGATTESCHPAGTAVQAILDQASAAVSAEIELIQIREKKLPAGALFELVRQVVGIAATGPTRVLVNDRADIAAAAGADGVHLTTGSLPAEVIRRTFGRDFLIGVSTHSLDEARAARDDGADFAVLGPVFATASKQQYGEPLGLENFAAVTNELSGFPLLGLGGLSLNNASDCLQAGAAGIAGISLFADPRQIPATVSELRRLRKTGGEHDVEL
jgi:thiamine-phosphate pyrophosphorylase